RSVETCFLNHSMAGVTDLYERTPLPEYGQLPPLGMTAKEIFEHCSTGSVWSTGRSGMPVATPALSLQPSAGRMSLRNSAVVPSSTTELPHAAVTPFLPSSGLSFESAVTTVTSRQASPPCAFTYCAHALTPSTEPWKRPGRSGEPTSAMTVTLISVGVTPISLDSNVLPLHASVLLAVLVGPPRPVSD